MQVTLKVFADCMQATCLISLANHAWSSEIAISRNKYSGPGELVLISTRTSEATTWS